MPIAAELLLFVASGLWLTGGPGHAEALAAPSPYARDVMVRVQLRGDADVQLLESLPLDVWRDRLGIGEVLARVDERDVPSLRASGLPFHIEPANLAQATATERARLATRPAALHGDGSFFADFRDYAEIRAELDALVAAKPERATLVEFGTSLERRPMLAVEITTTADADAPVIVINAAQHAREWISASSAVFVANALADHEADLVNGPRIESLLAQAVFVVAPVINPDGYVFSWEEERYWRKNRRGGFGVDTNRNFAVAWGGPGASNNTEANNYRGDAPFSEPEAAALRDLLRGYASLRVHLDMHSFGQLVLYPWGFVASPSPAQDVFAALATDIADAMDSVRGETYEPMPGAQLYPAAGNAPDWSYGELGAYAVTLELRPAEARPHNEGFSPAPDQILPAAEEALAGVLVLAEFALGAGPGMPGDDGAAGATTDGSTGATEGEPGAGTTGANDPSDPRDPTDPSGPADPSATASNGTSGDAGAGSTAPDPLSGSGATGSSRGGSEGTGTAADTADDDGGCSCRGGTRPGPAALLFPLLLFGAGRRRGAAPLGRRAGLKPD